MRASRLAPVGVVGAGAAGGALAAALAHAGLAVVLWDRDTRRAVRVARSAGGEAARRVEDLLSRTRALLIAVSDSAVADVAADLARRWPRSGGPRVVWHTSGSQGVAALKPLRRAGAPRPVALGVLHPAAALLGPRSAERLCGATVSLSGDRAAQVAGRALARSVGLKPVALRDARRPLAHLAATMSAGDVVALLGMAEDLLTRAGLRQQDARRLVARLAEGAVRNYAAVGARKAITGPVARGDTATLERHFAALRDAGRGRAALAAAHAALVLAGARILAGRRRRPAPR